MHRNKYIPYRDIPRYTGLYIDRKGIYRNIRGITQYIRIGKIKKIARFKPRTSCILHSYLYHCTTSVDAEQILLMVLVCWIQNWGACHLLAGA